MVENGWKHKNKIIEKVKIKGVRIKKKKNGKIWKHREKAIRYKSLFKIMFDTLHILCVSVVLYYVYNPNLSHLQFILI